MIYNQLRAVPTEETLTYLSEVMSGSPLDLDIESWTVEVITTLDAVTACPDNVYNATALNVKVWYDAYLQRSNLILSLESSDLQQRYKQLTEQGVVREWFSYYNPHIVIRKDMPALAPRYKHFVYATANALCGNERILQFTGEYVTHVDLQAPLNFEYNEAMIAERAQRRNY